MNDYRNTQCCKTLVDIIDKKKNLQMCIREKHPNIIDHYPKISDKNKHWYKCFCRLYNCKCAYCGVHVWIVGDSNIEIDHFICKSSFGRNSLKDGDIKNLVVSCRMCNRSKGALLVDSSVYALLHPDLGINEVFTRNMQTLEIEISSKHQQNPHIENFYKTLRLYYQVRRIDFLLMEMANISEYTQEQIIKDKLKSSIYKIFRKKHITSTKKDIT